MQRRSCTPLRIAVMVPHKKGGLADRIVKWTQEHKSIPLPLANHTPLAPPAAATASSPSSVACEACAIGVQQLEDEQFEVSIANMCISHTAPSFARARCRPARSCCRTVRSLLLAARGVEGLMMGGDANNN